jgi:cytochrome c
MRSRMYLKLPVIVFAILATGIAVAEDAAMLELANARGCFICHTVVPGDSKGNLPLGPSYQEVALRYRGDENAFDRLFDRVLHGTAYRQQAWEGKVSMRFMPPNVNLSREEAGALVHWILKLDIQPEVAERLTYHDNMMALATYSGCMICHRVNPFPDRRLVPLAPSLREIAAEYKGRANAKNRLTQAVLEGTVGAKVKTWENVNMRFMPPNVNVKEMDAERIVAWILELDVTGVERRRVAPKRN